ncbi:LamG-like jellyroll fold domain-containing protein [Minisyncoccus archaeiphilus]|uniref:LamG-like jellyroll fold domain-containing protein n=1 Tax=Minisyncoccus archaeiphilus TaxID=3238481 RepID=UPI00399CFEF8
MKRAFTLIELLVIIAIIAILAAFIISNLGSSRSLAQDAVRKNDISNLYKSIVGKNALSESSYPDIVSSIEPGKTNSNLQSFIDQFLKTTPYDPNPTKAYLYKGNGKDFSIAAILDDGSCFIKSTGLNLFGSDTICNTYSEGGIGLVQNFMFLHGSTYLDLIWSIPASLSSLPTSNVSSAIICLDSATELDINSLPSDEYLFTHGTIVTLVNNAVNEYRITLDNPDYYYYCKTYSYDNTVITNPGVPGSSPNTSTGGFSSSSSSSYSSSSPSTYTPGASSNPPSIGGSTTTGGSTSPSFNLEPIRNPDGTGSITLSWIPGYLSTHTLIRRDYNNPPETRTDGTSIYYERNDKDNQDITSIHYHTDTGLSEDYIYCYSAWAYDERTNTYSNGFVLACGGVPPSNPTNLTMTSTTNSFNLNWTKGSSTNTVIRRSINTPPTNQEQGTLVYNSTSSSFTDTDITLTKNTTYCYSIWSYNPTTASLSTEYLSSCGTLSNMATPTNLSFPTVAYNSIILNWTPGTGSTNTLIVRKQGSIPTSRTDGTTIYEDNGNAFIDTGLTDNTEYCYALYATDNTEYTEPLTGCQTTQAITGLVSYWKFDEGTGTTAYDSAGTNHGTLTNGPTWKTSSDCISGGCLQFDGSNDYVDFGNPSSLQITESITMTGWVMWPNSAIKEIFLKNNNTNDRPGSYEFYQNNNTIVFRTIKDGVMVDMVSTTIIPINTWVHIVATWDGSVKSIYIDGVKDLSTQVHTSPLDNTSGKFTIGAYANDRYAFIGLIDDVRIYDRALSSQEVASLYSLGLIARGQCGSANGSSFYDAPIENLCSYGTPSLVSGVGPWSWTCSGTSSSVSCSANKSVDGDCGTASNIEHTSVPSTGLCSIGNASAVTGDGVPYSWTCTGINGGSVANCKATKIGWIDTGLGFYVMKYEAKIQGNNNGNQTYSSSFVPESRASGTPWANITQAQAINECQSLGSGYHLITNAEWTALARNIESVAINWSGGGVGVGVIPRGYSAVLSTDGFANTVPAASTGAGYEYNNGANQVGATGSYLLKRVHYLSNGGEIWDLSGNIFELGNDSCLTSQWYNDNTWMEWGNANLSDYEKLTAGPVGNYDSSQGIGVYYGCVTDGRVMRRGANWRSGSNAGIFTLSFLATSSEKAADWGFRCAK